MARKLYQHQSLTTVFQGLIYGFTSRHCLLSTHSSQSRTVLYQNLLQGFSQTYDRCRAQELREAQVNLCSLKKLFAEYASAIEEWRQSQESLADDFSILEVLDLTGNEIRHSMVLAWLLDHDFARSEVLPIVKTKKRSG